jgi:predicted phosphoribosyltransferase
MSAPSTPSQDLVVTGVPVGVFNDRAHAGRVLAVLLERVSAPHPVVVGIPRGGVPVAAEVADALAAPLDVVLARKIGAPRNPEYALGAVAEGGVHVVSAQAARALRLSEADVRALIERAEDDLAGRMRAYRGTRAAIELDGCTAIVVDDGLATGRSARAALRSVRRRGAARVILAVPVAAPQAVEALRGEADQIVCVQMPRDLWAVGIWYLDFRATSDEQVADALAARADRLAALDAHGAGGQR